MSIWTIFFRGRMCVNLDELNQKFNQIASELDELSRSIREMQNKINRAKWGIIETWNAELYAKLVERHKEISEEYENIKLGR